MGWSKKYKESQAVENVWGFFFLIDYVRKKSQSVFNHLALSYRTLKEVQLKFPWPRRAPHLMLSSVWDPARNTEIKITIK